MNQVGDRYWRQTRRLTFALLVVWALVTFYSIWYAASLNTISLFGFPLGFYMGAQGLPIIYLVLIWIYNRCMQRLDARYKVDRD